MHFCSSFDQILNFLIILQYRRVDFDRLLHRIIGVTNVACWHGPKNIVAFIVLCHVDARMAVLVKVCVVVQFWGRQKTIIVFQVKLDRGHYLIKNPWLIICQGANLYHMRHRLYPMLKISPFRIIHINKYIICDRRHRLLWWTFNSLTMALETVLHYLFDVVDH